MRVRVRLLVQVPGVCAARAMRTSQWHTWQHVATCHGRQHTVLQTGTYTVLQHTPANFRALIMNAARIAVHA